MRPDSGQDSWGIICPTLGSWKRERKLLFIRTEHSKITRRKGKKERPDNCACEGERLNGLEREGEGEEKSVRERWGGGEAEERQRGGKKEVRDKEGKEGEEIKN